MAADLKVYGKIVHHVLQRIETTRLKRFLEGTNKLNLM